VTHEPSGGPESRRREIYLDWNATTPPHPSVVEAMQRASSELWANPSSVVGFEARDVVFTSGASEANNLALRSAPGIATSRIEHPSVVRVAEELEAQGRPVQWLAVPPNGRIEIAAVELALGRLPRGSIVALMAANHETGVIQPVDTVGELAHAAGCRLHVDAAQALGKLGPETWQGADSIAVAAHKIRGPKGIGALAFRPEVPPRPVLVGGAQERGLRPGTQDAVAAAGFAAALERVPEGPARQLGLAALRDRIELELAEVADVNGQGAPRLPHVANLSFKGARGDELVAALDLLGVRVSSGSACSAGTSEPSAVIAAMHGPERAASALRLSLGETTTADEIECALGAIQRVLALGARAGVFDLK
jgi:cysteine desulfurase